MVLMVCMGVISYKSIPKEGLPEVVLPTVYITTSYFGNASIDIENFITRPIEKEIKSLNGVKKITSNSVQDHSTIIVEFTTSCKVAKALQDVKDAVDKAKANLPVDLEADPSVFEVNFSEIPIMLINLAGDYSIDALKYYAELLKDEIERLPEISKIRFKGIINKEIQINADPNKMAAMKVSFFDIEKAVAAENITLSGGDISSGTLRRALRVSGEYRTAQEINKVVVKNENNHIVYVEDVAEVLDTYEARKSYARANRLPVVILEVVKRSGENILVAAQKIKRIIAQAQRESFPKGLTVSINHDMSQETKNQIDNLENSIIAGMLLVVLVLLFFLGFKNAIFVGIAIPLSMFMAFTLLHALGITLNMMVLFALVLALGMLVDNGIVVIENIYRLYEAGYSPMHAAKEGVGEIALPIIASTATTLVAFLPLLFWEGVMGEFMKYLPLTLIIVLVSSLFVALVINPVIAVLFMPTNTQHFFNKKRLMATSATLSTIALFCYFGRLFTLGNLCLLLGMYIPLHVFVLNKGAVWFQQYCLTRLENVYDHALHFCFEGKNPYWVLGSTVSLLLLAIGLFIIRPPQVVFFSQSEPEYINVFIEKPIGTTIEATNQFTKNLEDKIIALLQPHSPIVASVIAHVGGGIADPTREPKPGMDASYNEAKITIYFVPFEQRKGISTKKIMLAIRRLTNRYAGVQIGVWKNQKGPPVGEPISIEVTGKDYEKLETLSNRIIALINSADIQGIEALTTDLEKGNPELLVQIDRDKAGRYGLSTHSIAMELKTALFGKRIAKFKDGEDEYGIQLRLQDSFKNDIETLLNKKIVFKNQGKVKTIPISSLADAKYSSTYGSIKRKNLNRAITITSGVMDGYNAHDVNRAIVTLLRDFDMPVGYHIAFTGEQEEQQKSMNFLRKALFVAIFLIFLILVTQFNALSTPCIILVAVILSIIGVLLGLFIFNMDFVVIMTGIGIVSLAGIVVNNAIVLVDYTDLLKQRTKTELKLSDKDFLPYDALVTCITLAGKTRLRPVLLTAITTVLGLIPLAMGININFFTLFSDFDPQFYFGGDNADLWGPMAWTVIFGLTFATFLTLVVVPVMYLILENIKQSISQRMKR